MRNIATTDTIPAEVMQEILAKTQYSTSTPVTVTIELPLEVAHFINEEAKKDNLAFELKTAEVLLKGVRLLKKVRKQMQESQRSIIPGLSR